MTDIASILEELKQERDRIDAALGALEKVGNIKRLGRPKRGGRRGSREMSAAARRKMSAAAKARWARRKKAGKNSL
jgi:hypothetical protein